VLREGTEEKERGEKQGDRKAKRKGEGSGSIFSAQNTTTPFGLKGIRPLRRRFCWDSAAASYSTVLIFRRFPYIS